MAAINGSIVFPFNLPPILGLGNTGGFQYVLEALQGQRPNDVAAVTRGLLVSANQQPELAAVFSTFAADTPQIRLDIDRDKALVLGVKVSDVFNALQSTFGGFYINDLNLFGRTWQVNVQAEAPFRDTIDDIYRVYVRSNTGAMVPIRALAQARLTPGTASSHPLQWISCGDRQRGAQARLQLRSGIGGDGTNFGYTADWIYI